MNPHIDAVSAPVRDDSSSGTVTGATFKSVFRNHPAGVAIITLRGLEGPVGFTATSVFSISVESPLIGFSVAGTSSLLPTVKSAHSLVVNFLAADQAELAAQFARSNINRFAGVEWRQLPTGEPVLDGGTAWIRGEIERRTSVGESLLVVVRATGADHNHNLTPLVYVDRAYHHLGDHSRLG